MGSFGLPVVDSKIVATGRLKPFMAQDRFDVSDWTAIEKQSGCRRVPQDVWPHFFLMPASLRWRSKYRQRSPRLSLSLPFWQTKSARQSSLRDSRYRLIQMRERAEKNTVRSLPPLPMIFASFFPKSMLSWLSDNNSEMRIAVPSSASTTALSLKPL